jgi:serine/threonine-protein kinase SRPK3
MEKKRGLFNHLTLFPTPRLSFHLNIAFKFSRVGSSKRGMADLRSPSKPHIFPNSGWEIIDPLLPIEEESIPTYRAEKFYPVRIGEVFNNRYQVVGKLGYGSSATVWLCRDLL